MPSIRAAATKKTTTLTVAVKCRRLTDRERGCDIVRVNNEKDPDLSKDYLERVQNRTKDRRYSFDYAFSHESKNLLGKASILREAVEYIKRLQAREKVIEENCLEGMTTLLHSR